MAALRAGFAQSARLARLRPRADLQARRHAGGVGRAGRPGAAAAQGMILRLFFLALLLVATAAHAASNRRPPPPGAFAGAPPQYTKFTTRELTRGFLALAFGSDLRLGVRPKGVRRFDRNVTAFVSSDASVDRKAAME